MFQSFLIKYAEIGVKGKNRYVFEDAMVDQIRFALKKVECRFDVHKTSGRIYVDAKSEFDFDEVVEALQKVFGISGICPVKKGSTRQSAKNIPAKTNLFVLLLICFLLK